MSLKFIRGAASGKNDFWRYCVGVIAILGCWLASAVVAQLLSLNWWRFQGAAGPLPSVLESSTPGLFNSAMLGTYVLLNLSFLVLGLSVLAVVTVLHQRSPLTLISPYRQFCYRRVGAGFGVWFAIAMGQTAIEYWLRPEAFVSDFSVQNWLLFLPLALILTPIQTSAEEIFFRGYLLQAMGLVIRQPTALALVASLPFATVHFANPEMGRDALWMGLAYFLLAIFLTGITLKDGRLELALGAHAANNLFVALFVNTQDSVLQTPALTVQQFPPDPRLTVLSLLVACALFYFCFFGRNQRNHDADSD